MDECVRVILRGGPDGTPEIWQFTHGDGGDETQVKVPRGNGYDHFEFADEYDVFSGEFLPVYRWRYRTFIAE